MKKTIFLFTILLTFTSLLPQRTVLADAAPPEAPPGTNLLPGESITQVRMVAETVTLTISKHPSNPQGAIAKTEAVFTMRNLGAVEEKMAVRFPLSFFDGSSDGYGNFPEINAIVVKVDGKPVPTRREIQPFAASERSYRERDELPWAVFDVTFPPNRDVVIEVVYSVNGYGYYPYEAFKYILETGAGWNGTIGSAEIIVRLPYEANTKNIWGSDESGYGETTPGGVLSGNEIRWSFKDLEPTWEDNIQIVLVIPSLWETILKESVTVEKNPNDGEAWGRLAKAYKEVTRMPKGYLRGDSAGREMYELSKAAYEKCLALLPNDPLWHYGYADLLWAHYAYDIYWMGEPDAESILPTILSELQTTLALDPNNQQAKDLLLEMSYMAPEAVGREGDDFVLLGLTATPIPPTRFPTETPLPSTPTPVSAAQTESTPEAQPAPTEVPTARNPLCGSAFLLPALLGMVFIAKRKK
jgi:hypothetical protein